MCTEDTDIGAECPVCEQPLQADDMCATDIELGICHAACLDGAPVVGLNTGEELPESELDVFRYGDVSEPESMKLRDSYAFRSDDPPPAIALHDADGAYVTIKNSGEVTLREGLEISDTARCFWGKLAEVFPQFKASVLSQALTKAEMDVSSERRRQVSEEGWDAEHDDNHQDGTLALAAAVYALPRQELNSKHGSGFPLWRVLWPWDGEWLKRTDRRRDLVKAAALIIAEIERLDRAALNGGGDG